MSDLARGTLLYYGKHVEDRQREPSPFSLGPGVQPPDLTQILLPEQVIGV